MRTGTTRTARLAAGVLLGGCCMTAQAATLDFFCITGNNFDDCATGEAQLAVAVTDPGNGQVLFTFSNTGANASTISEVYFDDGTLLGIAAIDNSDPGVSFYQFGVNPPDLPGGNSISPPFQVTAGFSADADDPAPKWGVSPGETLGILFNLQAGKAYHDVLVDLYTGDLRIGMHVIAFAGGGSESFVNNPGDDPNMVVPLPAAVWLLGSGLMGLVAVSTRRRA